MDNVYIMRTGFRQATDEERRALGVPPAYTEVCVPVDPKSRLLAVARIPNGKTYYKYAKTAVQAGEAAKWKRVAKLASKLEKIEARLNSDVEKGVSEAFCVRLILLTGMRNGNPPQGLHETFGASSLRLRHVQVQGQKLVFDFPGKHNVPQRYEVDDHILLEYVKRRRLAVQYSETFFEERLFIHSASDTLKYLKKIGAEKVHDLRTLRANVLATELVRQVLETGRPGSKKALKATIKYISTVVASTLGNKPGQALKSYIDPSVLEQLSGALEEE